MSDTWTPDNCTCPAVDCAAPFCADLRLADDVWRLQHPERRMLDRNSSRYHLSIRSDSVQIAVRIEVTMTHDVSFTRSLSTYQPNNETSLVHTGESLCLQSHQPNP